MKFNEYFWQPAKYCKFTGKVMYDKKGAISQRNKRWKEDGSALRVYPCHGHWHLTHQIKEIAK